MAVFWRAVHTFTLVSTSLQRPLSSVPKVAVVELFNGSTCVPELRVVVNPTMIVASLACACTRLLCHQTLWPHTMHISW